MARSQPFPTFGAAALDDKATGFGAHALAKAVSLSALAIIWLKSPLHSISLLIKCRKCCYLKTGRLAIVTNDVKETSKALSLIG